MGLVRAFLRGATGVPKGNEVPVALEGVGGSSNRVNIAIE